jgi:SAM-dependent methyltransferase
MRSFYKKVKSLIPEKIRYCFFLKKVSFIAFCKKILHRLGLSKLVWRMSLPSEYKFWTEYIETKGRLCNAEDEFLFRLDPDSEVQSWLKEHFLIGSEASLPSVLDVGSGPFTWIGKKWGNFRLHIEAIDPLADLYNALTKAHNLKPPVVTKPISGENLLKHYNANNFDLVFARNSLDHSYNGVQIIKNMVTTLKPGGVLYLWHAENEGHNCNYQGLHQWNFQLEENSLILWRLNEKFIINDYFKHILVPLKCGMKDKMIEAVYRKIV